MRRKRKGFFLFFILSFCILTTASAGNIGVKMNGYPLPLSVPATIQNDRVLVPMRSIMEALGYTVIWHQDSYSVEAKKGDKQLLLTIDNPVATINQEAVVLDTAALLSENTTMVPLRFVAEYSGATVEWDEKTTSVSIMTNQISQGDLTDSVVYIQTNKMQGSGIILSSEGIIATNFHVIENASTVQMVFADGSIYQGNTTIVGLDPQKDVALLHIDKKGLLPAKTETSITKGESVTAVGAPNGARNTQTKGVIKGFDQNIMETSALIAHGSSGGALYNNRGNLIGMTTAYSDTQYFSIPIEEVLNVKKNLSIPISEMKNFTYRPSAPRNLRFWLESNYAYLAWAPVYDADYYYVYIAYSENGSFTKLKNQALGGDIWYWGFPQCFGISVAKDHSIYVKVSAVRDGVETVATDVMKITMN